jgi:hypothetical protein
MIIKAEEVRPAKQSEISVLFNNGNDLSERQDGKILAVKLTKADYEQFSMMRYVTTGFALSLSIFGLSCVMLTVIFLITTL